MTQSMPLIVGRRSSLSTLDLEIAWDESECLLTFFNFVYLLIWHDSLAYVEMRIMLARLLWNFDLVLAEESKAWMETQKIYTLWEKGPLNVYLKPIIRD